MHKITKTLAAALTLSLVMTGCQSGGNLAKRDYKALDYVKLGEYKGLEAEQIEEKKELTEEEKEAVLEEVLSAYSEETEVTGRGAQTGDYVSMSYKCYQDGELIDESGDEEIETQLGAYTFFDEEGEAQLMGCQPGDKRTIKLTESDGEDEYNYTYEVEISRIYDIIMPEADDEIAQTEGYASLQEMEDVLYQNALDTANQDYLAATKAQLLQSVVSTSEINGYPQSLYDKTYEQMNISYQDFFGMSLEELYADDEESLKAAVEETLAQELVVEALADQEKITVSKSELDEYKESIVALYDYTDVTALEEEYADEILIDSLLNEKVQDYLLSQAKITYVTEEEYYGYEEGFEEDFLDDSAEDEMLIDQEMTEDEV